MKAPEIFMQRCLEIASLGKGKTSPNPMVGSIIVHNNKIIGEGYHKKCGEAHAEVNAINSVKDKNLLKESTLYVNLEPCSHQGRTPACSKLIIESGIKKVVIGCTDSFEKVAGKGIKMLREAGCEVTVGVLENESLRLNKRFFTYHQKKRPYIILKWAETLDGYTDLIRKADSPTEPNWITDTDTRMLVHKWRSEEDAIMVGRITAEKDNPALNVRDWNGKNPIRILVAGESELNPDIKLLDNQIKTLIFTKKNTQSKENTEYIKIDTDQSILNQVLNELYKREILSVLIEGGSILHNSFIESGLWDEARVFVGNKMFYSGVKSPKIGAPFSRIIEMGKDKLILFKNENNFHI